jgi:esterase
MPLPTEHADARETPLRGVVGREQAIGIEQAMDIADKETVELHCQAAGEGPATILLLHGLFGMSANLGTVARHLSSHYRTLRCDLRNHGRSPHVASMNYEVMAGDVLRMLDQRGIDRCAVLGHSMGGKVAMQLALDHPERVAALIVADIAPVEYAPERHQAVFEALHSVPLAQLESRAQADEALSHYLPDADLRRFLLSNLYQRNGAFHWRFNLDSLYDNRGLLALKPTSINAYSGPVLFIKGELSDYITADSFEAVKARFPNARLHVVRGAGHWLHAEKPAAFNASVSRFTDRFYSPVTDQN